MKISHEKVQLAMARACMSLPEVAEKAGIPYGTVKYAMLGRQTKPKTAGTIAKVLGVDVTEIIQEDEV